MDVLTTESLLERETTTIYYDPHHHNRSKVSPLRNVFTQDARYKLYKDGRFFDMKNDILETSPLSDEELDKEQMVIKKKLAVELAKFPELPKRNF